MTDQTEILGHMYLVGFPLLDDDNMMRLGRTVEGLLAPSL